MSGGHVSSFSRGVRARRCACYVSPVDKGKRAAFRLRCQPSYKEFIAAADAKMEYNDRMGALREYEKALKDSSMDLSVRKTLLFNACCIHASFGDLELAQVSHSGA